MATASDNVDEMIQSLSAGTRGGELPVASSPIAKLGYSHEAMINLILSEPWISQNELAARFGYTPAWISTIMTSDIFKSKFAERSRELADPIVRASIEQQFQALAARSTEILLAKLNKRPEEIPDNLALRSFELSTRAANYGAQSVPGPKVEMNIHLDMLGENLVNVLRKAKASIDQSIEGEFSNASS